MIDGRQALRRQKSGAFTIVELMIMISIAGILVILVIPRIDDIGQINAGIAVDKVLADLRYAKRFAINHNCRSRVAYDSAGDTYAVSEDSSGSFQTAEDPTTRGNFIVDLNAGIWSGVGIGPVSFDGQSTVEFDSTGAPYSVSAGAPSPLSSDGSVEVGSNAPLIRVGAGSGRIYVET